MTDPAAHAAHSRRTLVSSTGADSGVRWVLEEEPDGGLVLVPRLWSWAAGAWLAAVYLALAPPGPSWRGRPAHRAGSRRSDSR